MDESSFASCNSASSEEGSLGNNVSCFLGEENLIDSLFFTCDVERRGRVSVSTILDYLTGITEGTEDNPRENLELLESILDPVGCDPEINLKTYRRGTAAWVQRLRLGDISIPDVSSTWSEAGDVFGMSVINSPSLSRPLVNRFLNLHQASDANCSISSPTCLGGGDTSSIVSPASVVSVLETEQEMSLTNMQSRIAELECQNRRLSEDTHTLRSQLELSEETNATMAANIDSLKTDIRIHHQIDDHLLLLRQENNDLKATVAAMEEDKRRLQQQLSESQRECSDLLADQDTNADQLLCMQSELDSVRNQLEDNQVQIQEHIKYYEDTEQIAAQLLEKTVQLEELQLKLEKMTLQTEDLQKEKTDIEQHLNDTLHQMSMLKQSPLSHHTAESSSDSEPEELMPVRPLPEVTSTPLQQSSSICKELLGTLLFEERGIASPICNKEIDDILFSRPNPVPFDLGISPDVPPAAVQNGESDVDAIMNSVMKSTTTKINCKDKAEHMTALIEEKKKHLLAQITGWTDVTIDRGFSESESMRKELDKFAEKMAMFVASKLESDERVAKLSSALRTVYEQNQELEEGYKDTISRLEVETRTRAAEVDQAVRKLSWEKERFLSLRKLLREKESENCALLTTQIDLKMSLSAEKEHVLSQAAKIESLQSYNEDLKSKYEQVHAGYGSLRAELEDTVVKEKQRLLSLEDTLISSDDRPHLDMKDLWRLVHNEVESKYISNSQEKPMTSSADDLRDQVAKEIKSLKSQLERSQAALLALQTRTLPLSRKAKNKESDSTNNKPLGGSSPLVEALTLVDMMNPLHIMQATHNPRIINSSEGFIDQEIDSGLDSNQNLSIRNDLTSGHHHSPKHITCSTQTERKQNAKGMKRRAPHVGTNKYAVFNSSTGSSTSGIEVSSVSSRSELPANPSRKSVYIVETAVDSSSDDPENPLIRHRTPSFKRAIERGASADSSSLSFDTLDPVSTSPDLSPDHIEYPSKHLDFTEYQRKYLDHRSDSTNSAFFPAHKDYSCDQGEELWLRNVVKVNLNSCDEAEKERLEFDDHLIIDSVSELNPLEGGESPRSRRLSTLVEESDVEIQQEDPRSSARRSFRTPPKMSAPPPYPGVSRLEVTPPTRHLSPQLPHYKEPPAYSQAVHGFSTKNDRPERSRSLSPSPPTRDRSNPPFTKRDINQPSSLPSSPQVSALSGSLKAKLEFRGNDENANDITNKEVTCTIVPERPTRDKSIQSRRKSLKEMRRQSSTNLMKSEPEPMTPVSDKDTDVLPQPPQPHAANLQKSSFDPLRSQLFDEGVDLEDEVFSGKNPPTQEKEESKMESSSHEKDLQQNGEQSSGSVDITKIVGKSSRVVASTDEKSREVSCDYTSTGEVADKSDAQHQKEETRCKETDPSQLPSPSGHPDADTSPPSPSNPQLAKIRQENIAKRRGIAKLMKMPDLEESNGTEEATVREPNASPSADQETSPSKHSDTSICRTGEVFPSVPDMVLQKLGLVKKKGIISENNTETSPEQELEDKFASLALAFKTDKLTLDKRLERHRRARDITEQNIDREMEGVKETLQILGNFCVDSESRDVFNKIRHHVEVLETSTARMSTHAEVLGAVQQESRLSNAIEVMIQHVENLKKSLDKEHAELEETKKLLKENRMGPGGEGDFLQRRNFSISGGAGAKGARRRASVAVFPRAQLAPPHPVIKRVNFASENVDPKKPPPSLLSGATKHVGDIVRRASLAFVNSQTFHNAASSLGIEHHASKASTNPQPIDSNGSGPVDPGRASPDLVENLRSSVEGGLKAEDLDHLRQIAQNSSTFEDDCDLHEPLRYEDHALERFVDMWPGWEVVVKRLRVLAAGLIFLLGLLTLTFTLLPRGSAYDRDRSWSELERSLWPYLEWHHRGMPPV